MWGMTKAAAQAAKKAEEEAAAAKQAEEEAKKRDQETVDAAAKLKLEADAAAAAAEAAEAKQKVEEEAANAAAAAAKTAEVAVQNEVQYQTRSNRICPKKEIIFDKLDTLLKKLGAETFNRKQTDAAAQANADATLKAWLDAESEYRIQEEKVKEAEEGSKFARERYKKYSEIVKQTQERLDTMKPTYNKELEDNAERSSTA